MIITGFSLVVGTFILVYLLCQVAALVRWHGLRRWVAAVPALVVGSVAVKIVYELGVDLDSHKLWPIEALLWSAVGLGFLSAAYLVYGVIELAHLSKNRGDARVDDVPD